jgi:hypothetical protein
MSAHKKHSRLVCRVFVLTDGEHVEIIVDDNVVKLSIITQSENSSQTTGVHDVSKATGLVMVKLVARVLFRPKMSSGLAPPSV